MRYAFCVVQILTIFNLLSCSGMKVIHPDRPNNKDARILQINNGNIELVKTYTCTLVASNGSRIYAIGKTESEAREEVVAKCKDQTLISFCFSEKAECEKN